MIYIEIYISLYIYKTAQFLLVELRSHKDSRHPNRYIPIYIYTHSTHTCLYIKYDVCIHIYINIYVYMQSILMKPFIHVHIGQTCKYLTYDTHRQLTTDQRRPDSHTRAFQLTASSPLSSSAVFWRRLRFFSFFSFFRRFRSPGNRPTRRHKPIVFACSRRQ